MDNYKKHTLFVVGFHHARQGRQGVSAYLGVCAPVEVDWFRDASMYVRLASCCSYAVRMATYTGIVMSNAVQGRNKLSPDHSTL
jgi:hypothetical protein